MRIRVLLSVLVLGLAGGNLAQAQESQDLSVCPIDAATGLYSGNGPSHCGRARESQMAQMAQLQAGAGQSPQADSGGDQATMDTLQEIAKCTNGVHDARGLLKMAQNTARANNGNLAAAIDSLRKSYCRATNEVNQVQNNQQSMSNQNTAQGGAGGSSYVMQHVQQRTDATASAQAEAMAAARVEQHLADTSELRASLWDYFDMSIFSLDETIGISNGPNNAVYGLASWNLRGSLEASLRLFWSPLRLGIGGEVFLPFAGNDSALKKDWGLVITPYLSYRLFRHTNTPLEVQVKYGRDVYQGNQALPNSVVTAIRLGPFGGKMKRVFALQFSVLIPINPADLLHPNPAYMLSMVFPGGHH